jgi:hypothetical protein
MVWCKKINIPSVPQAGKTIKQLYETVGRDSSVGIVTCHGLGGLRMGGGVRFSTPIQTSPGTHPASYTMDTESFPGVKWPECGVDHHPHLAPGLKKSRATPLLPLWAFVSCPRVNFTSIFI